MTTRRNGGRAFGPALPVIAADLIVAAMFAAGFYFLHAGWHTALAMSAGIVAGLARENYRYAIESRAFARRVAQAHGRVRDVAGPVGGASAFATGSYAGARLARDVHAVETGRIGTRLLNKAIGRLVVSRLWVR